jgi:hypothetical protein
MNMAIHIPMRLAPGPQAEQTNPMGAMNQAADSMWMR